MTDSDQKDNPETTDQDTEGHSMFLYEGARQQARQQQHDADKAAREARMMKEGKPEGRRWFRRGR